jgi:hypothetical protein
VTQSEDTEEVETEESLDDDEKSMLQKRVSALLLIIGGVLSSIITHTFISFSDVNGLLPVLPIGLAIILILKIMYDEFSGKTVLFVFLVTTVMWFISGTFILQFT